MKTVIAIRFDLKLIEQIKKLCEAKEQTFSQFVRQAVKNQIKKEKIK